MALVLCGHADVAHLFSINETGSAAKLTQYMLVVSTAHGDWMPDCIVQLYTDTAMFAVVNGHVVLCVVGSLRARSKDSWLQERGAEKSRAASLQFDA